MHIWYAHHEGLRDRASTLTIHNPPQQQRFSVCDAVAFSSCFSQWRDFKAAANAGSKGFDDLPRGSAVYCIRAREVPLLSATEIADAYLRSPLFPALEGLDAAAAKFFDDCGLGPGWGWSYAPFARKRLKRIADLPFDEEGKLTCPIVYFGRSNDLPRRMHELLWLGHTANHPLWALLNAGWELDLGYRLCEDEKTEENRLKNVYRAGHGGRLPPLMNR